MPTAKKAHRRLERDRGGRCLLNFIFQAGVDMPSAWKQVKNSARKTENYLHYFMKDNIREQETIDHLWASGSLTGTMSLLDKAAVCLKHGLVSSAVAYIWREYWNDDNAPPYGGDDCCSKANRLELLEYLENKGRIVDPILYIDFDDAINNRS